LSCKEEIQKDIDYVKGLNNIEYLLEIMDRYYYASLVERLIDKGELK